MVDSTVCHVVEVLGDSNLKESDILRKTIYIGFKDNLPRKIVSHRKLALGEVVHEQTFRFLQKAEPKQTSGFELKKPEFYTYQPFLKGASPKPLAVDEPSPVFTLKDEKGNVHSLSDYKGKIVVINFWESGCGYSNIGLNMFNELSKKYKGDQVKFLSISFKEDEAINPSLYLKERGFSIGPNLLNGETIGEQFHVRAVPAYYVIDDKGKVAYGILQYNPQVKAEIDATLKRLIDVFPK